MLVVHRELMERYLETYFPSINDEDSIKNEKKKIHNLLVKLNNKESVFKGLPFYSLNLTEQVKLLHFILEEIDERQIINNLGKVDADKDYSNIEMDDEETEAFTRTFFKEEMPDYEPLDIQSMLISNRLIIRSEQDMQLLLDYLKQSNEEIIRLLTTEYNAFYMMGLHFENLNYVKEYIDYVINDILQLVVYRVISNPDVNTFAILQELSEETRNLSDKIDFQLIRKWEKQKENDILTASQVLKYFSAYLKHRSKLKEETDIYSELEKEVKQTATLFGNVPEKYRADKVFLSEEEIKEAGTIITEGKSIYQYEQKLSTVQEFINIMNIYGGRQCYSNCLQDLKVYFREIYMSKATYKRQQARKIVENYIKKVNFAVANKEAIPEFDKQSQYMFVREKISRGYFREKGLLVEYFGKIKFTNELYDLLLKIYWLYDFEDALEFLYEINCNFLKKFNALVEV